MTFKNRTEAAKLLSKKLKAYNGKKPLVFAIPRGGVPMGQVIAKDLHGDLDVILVHKLSSPWNPEFALGAISESGQRYLSTDVSSEDDVLQRSSKEQLENLKKRRALYSKLRKPIDAKNRIIILVDDGMATGSTMLAAIQELRRQRPKKIVVAAAVAAPEVVERVCRLVDEVVVLHQPMNLRSVGYYFDDFSQVSDSMVESILSVI